MRITDIKRTTQVFALKTSIAHEKSVAEMISEKLKYKEPKPDIMSIVWIEQLRGYVFVEATHQRDVMLAISDIKHVKGRVLGQVKMEELEGFLKPEKITEKLEIGDKVEIIAGLFSGEKAYVGKIDESKDEVTLSLIGSDTQIPIKLNADYLKIIEKGTGVGMTAEIGEGTVVGKGIKEFTFGDQEPSSTKVEDFADEFDKEEQPQETPEVVVYSGRKQKVVGDMTLFDSPFEDEEEGAEDLDDEFGSFEEPYTEAPPNGEKSAGPEDEAKDKETSSDKEEEEDGDW
nr:transcription elongation factor Spt5 [Candidatus Sigynarchaeota archaeon]